MSSRNYDVILKVANASGFRAGNTVMGNQSLTVGYVAYVDTANSSLKVKLANTQQEFRTSETLQSNIITVTTTANGSLNTTYLPYQAPTYNSSILTTSSTITSITPSSFIAEKNAFTQNPIVRLYSIYYPGEWYPSNDYGNPSGPGAGYAWPTIFPIRIAEIVGDISNDINYKVKYDGISYTPYPINISGLEQASDGKVNELSLSVFNVDNYISSLVENPYLVGLNTSNSISTMVNGELLQGIDPRTVGANALSNTAIVGYYGTTNAPFDKVQTDLVGGTWQPLKTDTRDLLGAAVELKTTFANFLDYWPEYSLVSSVTANVVTMLNTLPYRVGDVLLDGNTSHCNTTVQAITPTALVVSRPLVDTKSIIAQTTSVTGLSIPSSSNIYISSSTNIFYQYSTANYSLGTATYVGSKTLSQEPATTGIYMTSSGNNLYSIGTGNDKIYRYTLSTPYSIATATYSSNLSIASIDTSPVGIYLNPTGNNLFILGDTTDKIYKFTLSTPYDITTANLVSNISVGTGVTGTLNGLQFSPNGTNLYIMGVGVNSRTVFGFNLTTPWDISTATLTGNTYVGNYETSLKDLSFTSTGDNLFIIGSATDAIYKIALDTPWDITTANTQATVVSTPLYIQNPQADTQSYLQDVYKIDQLEGLSDQVASFGLVSWLQYFKIVTPKRKYYKNTCQWVYKGPECQYPGPGGYAIPGTTDVSPMTGIAANNMIMPTAAGDVCAKSLAACTLRNNALHYGGFPGVGRTVPRM